MKIKRKMLLSCLFLAFILSACGQQKEVNKRISESAAIEIAESAWIKTYKYTKSDLDRYKPYLVELKSGTWYIRGGGNWSKSYAGGYPYIEIKETDGEILKVIHYK